MKSILLSASLLFSGTALITAATIPDLVNVGYAGNAPDASGYGSVAYEYSIGVYEVTNSQYAEFLNAVAKSDPYGLYNTNMGLDSGLGGISRSGDSGSYVYTTRTGYENRPVNHVSFTDAARYVNWLTNGGENGDTETGSYTISATHTEMVRIDPAPGMTVQYFVASENEWYKAAYYDPTKNDGEGGYWLYPTQSDAQPTAGAPTSAANRANFNRAVNGLTDVGSYINSSSFFGTYDQEGNLGEILDTIWNAGWVRRGSSYSNTFTGSNSRTNDANGTEANSLGFRIVMIPAQIPEPSTVVLFGGGILGGILWRLKKASDGKGAW